MRVATSPLPRTSASSPASSTHSYGSSASSTEEPPLAHELRERLVNDLVAAGEIDAPAVVQAMRAVPRHEFVPEVSLQRAYEDRALPIGHEQTISQPAVVGMMTQALELTGHDRVLEIGTGSGYQAAVVACLARDVYTIERVGPLARLAKDRLAKMGYENVHVRCGDGFQGWPERASFDRIILTAAPAAIPPRLLEQLAPDGILVAPVGPQGFEGQMLVRVRKRGGHVEFEELSDVTFVEMQHGQT